MYTHFSSFLLFISNIKADDTPLHGVIFLSVGDPTDKFV